MTAQHYVLSIVQDISKKYSNTDKKILKVPTYLNILTK